MTLKRILWALLLLCLTPVAVAQQAWLDNTWGIKWNPNPSEEFVQGYRVYFEQADPLIVNQTDVGNRTTVFMSEFGLTNGRYEIWITAYNPAGESEPSARVSFVFFNGTVEGGGTGLSAPSGLEFFKRPPSS